MNLRSVDLNLLVILRALLEEGGVTGAARRLNLTQPAVSVALGRARQLFGDPLLVRTGARMSLTARARELAPRLSLILSEVEGLLASQDFDPSHSNRSFVVTATDLAELTLLPQLVAALRCAAPGVRLVVRSLEAVPFDAPDSLEGRVDLIYAGTDLPSPPYESCSLYEESFVVLARHGHPAFDGALDAAAFASLHQVLVSPRGGGQRGPIDESLAALGLRRFVAMTLSRFSALPPVLAATDLVACVPSRFAARPEVQAVATARPLPFPSPHFTMRLAWHRLHEADPAHRWVRAIALAAAAEAGSGSVPMSSVLRPRD